MDWQQLSQLDSSEDAWKFFQKNGEDIVEKYVPTKKRRNNSRPIYMNRLALRAIRKKRKLWEKYKTSNENVDLQTYKESAEEVVRSVKEAQKNFEIKLAANIKNDTKSFYRYARSKQKTKDSVGPLHDKNDHLISDNKSIATLLNDYFVSVFTEENLNALPVPTIEFRGQKALDSLEFTVVQIQAKLEKLNPNKAAGPDGIHPRLLKETSKILAPPLTVLFNRLLKEKKVPSIWKDANVTPLFKKGKHYLASNYRPVSLTSQVCKIFESCIKDAVVNHLEENNLLRLSQHGFMKKRSCLSNLLEFLENITDLIDKGLPVDVAYLDFQKAFDKVPHQRLKLKLMSHGIRGDVVDWISDWLKNRRQRVVINGERSEWNKVISGVPQGSVLGPVLFLVYVNDVDIAVTGKIIKFADDTKLYRSVETVEESLNLQQDLDNILE